MPQLTIEEIDDETLRRLEARARAHKRSVEAEAKSILEQATAVGDADALEARRAFAEWAAAQRERLKPHYKGDITADIRADRDR